MMSRVAPSLAITDELLEDVRQRLLAGKRVRCALGDGGRLHIDRQLPFLCLYRVPPGGGDEGTDQLVCGEASFLIAMGPKRADPQIARLIAVVVETLSERFGDFLLLEIWSAPDRDVAVAADRDDVVPTELQPDFVISARGPNIPRRTVDTLRRHLLRVSMLKQQATVHFDPVLRAHPSDRTYLLKADPGRSRRCHQLGLCVRPIYRDHESGELFPQVLRELTRGMGRALKQSFFTFAKTHTTATPRHFYSLGRNAMVKAVWDVDRRLAEISGAFDFILQVTPVNAEGAWREFRRGRFEHAPSFYYRPLVVEPTMLKRQIFDVPIEKIEDPTLSELFRQRQDELDRKITMLSDIGTPRFLLGSRQVYGDVESDLLEVAASLLEHVPTRQDLRGGKLNAKEFAERAEKEVAFYRARMPSFVAEVQVREDLFSGLLCSGGDLLIGHQVTVPAGRVEALLQHEVGTHLLTHYNGLMEPFRQLHSGFAGYDALQEGLAVLTEYLVGGLSRARMRILAARVLAARMMIDGASFIETFRCLDREHAFSQRSAYTITMRTYRGGGLTKDAVYLRGLMEILEYLRNGGEFEPLFVGKIAADHIPLIKELLHRNVLDPPVLRPRYFEMKGVGERIERTRHGLSALDLVMGPSA
ncbi:hypothetical protein Pan216_35940 [Planctomycetes bacterium Pan216]|uniref:DUF1704 domain-containing protein n=1 Tax=Kolteria novifilia TaxID=2527975 RepID=A0A518B6X0_9BACT|nr:hypothetical protein Pan216_35940 [Planctomycetes bacterium Pan216]